VRSDEHGLSRTQCIKTSLLFSSLKDWSSIMKLRNPHAPTEILCRRPQRIAHSALIVIACCFALGSFSSLAGAQEATTQPTTRPAQTIDSGEHAVSKGANIVNSLIRLERNLWPSPADTPKVPDVAQTTLPDVPEPVAPAIEPGDDGSTVLEFLAMILELFGL
jgi:hypothetical protein